MILDQDATPAPESFDINNYLNTTFRMYSSEHCDVELICDNSVLDSIIDRSGMDVTTYENNMTSFRVVVNVLRRAVASARTEEADKGLINIAAMEN